MFGLSKREVLIKAVKNTCDNKIPSYRAELESIFQQMTNGDSAERVEANLRSAMIDYMASIYAAMKSSFDVSSPAIGIRMGMTISNPSITGLPEEYDLDYFIDNGVPAGCVYAMCYYALIGKPISYKDFKDCSMLNHYQGDLMNNALSAVADKYGIK